jgi:hypothetical protein
MRGFHPLAITGLLAAIGGCGGGAGLQVDGGAAGRGGSTAAAAGRCGSTDASAVIDASDSSVTAVSNDPRCPSAWSSLWSRLPSTGFPATCLVNGLICTYPEGQGECAPDGAVLKWWTGGADPACSETAPKVGTACGVPGLSCGYITGPPTLESEFVTSYCCDGTRCTWAIEQGNGCPNGNICGTIKASDYDQSCTLDSDCVTEPEGNFCESNHCTNCAGAVISVKAQAQYEADLASKISTPFICPCPLGPSAVCNHGRCATALAP